MDMDLDLVLGVAERLREAAADLESIKDDDEGAEFVIDEVQALLASVSKALREML